METEHGLDPDGPGDRTNELLARIQGFIDRAKWNRDDARTHVSDPDPKVADLARRWLTNWEGRVQAFERVLDERAGQRLVTGQAIVRYVLDFIAQNWSCKTRRSL